MDVSKKSFQNGGKRENISQNKGELDELRGNRMPVNQECRHPVFYGTGNRLSARRFTGKRRCAESDVTYHPHQKYFRRNRDRQNRRNHRS